MKRYLINPNGVREKAKGKWVRWTDVKKYVNYATKHCPRCDDCKSLLLDGGVVLADGIFEKPCRVVCSKCAALVGTPRHGPGPEG